MSSNWYSKHYTNCGVNRIILVLFSIYKRLEMVGVDVAKKAE